MLILIRGIPGSGKSTIAQDLLKLNPEQFRHYENDMFLYDKEGNYLWSEERIIAANKKCYWSTKNALQLEFNVIVSNCFIKNSSIKRYAKLVNSEDLFIIETDTEYNNIHQVSNETIHSMKSNYEDLSENLKQRKISYGSIIYSERIDHISWIIRKKIQAQSIL